MKNKMYLFIFFVTVVFVLSVEARPGFQERPLQVVYHSQLNLPDGYYTKP